MLQTRFMPDTLLLQIHVLPSCEAGSGIINRICVLILSILNEFSALGLDYVLYGNSGGALKERNFILSNK